MRCIYSYGRLANTVSLFVGVVPASIGPTIELMRTILSMYTEITPVLSTVYMCVSFGVVYTMRYTFPSCACVHDIR